MFSLYFWSIPRSFPSSLRTLGGVKRFLQTPPWARGRRRLAAGWRPLKRASARLWATQPGKVALDGTGRNSPFANALIKHVQNTRADLSNILTAVRNDVLRETKGQQVPWGHSALTGRFYFDPAASVQPPPADEITWARIKEAHDPALLKRFIEQFPDSQKRPEAEKEQPRWRHSPNPPRSYRPSRPIRRRPRLRHCLLRHRLPLTMSPGA